MSRRDREQLVAPVLQDATERTPPPYVYTAAHMLARGRSLTEIAETVNRSARAVEAWQHRYPSVFRDVAKTVGTPEELLSELVPLAVRAQRRALEMVPKSARDMAVQAQVADSVLDRVYGKPTQHVDVSSRADIRVAFVDLTPSRAQAEDAQNSAAIDGRPAAMIGPAVERVSAQDPE